MSNSIFDQMCKSECKRLFNIKDNACTCEFCEKNKLMVAEANRKSELLDNLIAAFYVKHRQEAIKINEELDKKYPCLFALVTDGIYDCATDNMLGISKIFDDFIFKNIGECCAISPLKYSFGINMAKLALTSLFAQKYTVQNNQSEKEVPTCA